MRSALAHHQAGRVAEAGAGYRQVLSLEPSEPDALNLLGVLALSAESAEMAATLVRRAIALDGQAALFRFNLGHVLDSSGQTEEAARTYERALDLQPGHEGAARNLGIARVRLATSPEAVARFRRRWGTADDATYHPIDARRRAYSGPGHLLIRGWGCGFWGEVNHVAVQLVLSEIMGREPVVYWGNELRYRGPSTENAWEAYFEPVSAVDIATITSQGPACFPGQWTPGNLRTSKVQPLREGERNIHGLTALAGLDRPEPLVVADGYNEMLDVLAWAAPGHSFFAKSAAAVFRWVYAERIRLKADLRRQVEELAARHFTYRPILAVHYRASQEGKQAESLEGELITLEHYLDPIDRFIAAHPTGRIFLLCDLAPTVEVFQKRYRERLLSLPRLRLTNADQQDIGFNQGLGGHQLALEVLEDAYLAKECDYFLGDGASGVSCAIAVLKDWPEGRIQLLRRNVFQERRGGDFLSSPVRAR